MPGHSRLARLARFAVLVLGAALALTAPTVASPPAAHANSTGTGLVIDEIFTGNGSSGPEWYPTYVELFNPTGSPVELGGWSLQIVHNFGDVVDFYERQAPVPLTGVVPPYSHYLIASSSSGGGKPLPGPADEQPAFHIGQQPMSVVLADTTTQLTATGNLNGVPHVIDAVGWTRFAGTESWEGTGPVAMGLVGGEGTWANRGPCGADTDQTQADITFSAADGPSPDNSAVSEPLCAPPCRGLTPTVVGSGTITGTTADDVIVGSTGNDTIDGGDGNDTICSGGGTDTLNGGAGTDRLKGGNGPDTINGDTDTDLLAGGKGTDTINGGDGNDIARGGTGNDTINGNAGDDKLRGEAHRDTIHGGPGTDLVQGMDGRDHLHGDADNDWIYGGPDNDHLTDTEGTNTLDGGEGIDTINGVRE